MRVRCICLGLLLSLLLPSAAFAQNVFASVQGTVTDRSGAVVSGADVTAKNDNTGLERSAKTDDRGTYSLNLLPVGNYTILIRREGFQESVISGIVLQTDEHARRDVQLEVGSVNEHVTVESTSPIVQTDNATISEVVNNEEVNELPMNGRNLNQLALITGGVTPGNQSQPEAGSASTVQSFSVAGGRTSTNGFLIDGVANTDDAIDNSSLHPSLETPASESGLTPHPLQFPRGN